MLRMIIMALMLTLVACAGKSLVVRNADTLLEYQVEKRIPLYSAQKKALDKDIKKFLNENRQEAQELLPVVDELSLDESKKLEGQYRKLAALYERISAGFTKLLAPYLSALDQKQQREFFQTIEEENRLLASRDPEERKHKYRERFKTFFGSITEPQRQLMTDLQPDFEESNRKRLAHRKVLLTKFHEIFDNDLSANARKQEIQDAFASYHQTAHDHERNISLLKRLLPTLTNNQKEFFRKRMAEVKEIIKLYLDADY